MKFDEHGDGLGRYNIYNFRQTKQTSAGQLSGPGANNSSRSIFRDSAGGSQANETPTSGDGGGTFASELPLLDGTSLGDAAEPQSEPPAEKSANSEIPESKLESEQIFTSNAEFEYSSVGSWTENDYFIQLNDIQFIQNEHQIPESYCSRPCELGQAKIMRAGDHCCWICKTCAPYEYLPDEFSCRDCGIGRWPVHNKTSCFELPQKVLKWDSVYSLISLTIACLGIGLAAFVSIIFLKYIDTPVVKASGRELSFILLTGIAFCHLSTFVLLSKPTTFICGGQRFLVSYENSKNQTNTSG